jgi:hypothetical protein
MKPFILALLAMFTFAASAAAQTQDARVAAAATARDAFWQALERNDLPSARAMWTEDMQAEQTEEDFVADAGRLRRQTGAVIERRVMRKRPAYTSRSTSSHASKTLIVFAATSSCTKRLKANHSAFRASIRQ